MLNQGIRQRGKRAYERAVYKLASYLMNYCDYPYAMHELRKWTFQKCSPELIDREQAFTIMECVCRRVYFKPIKQRKARKWNAELTDEDKVEICTDEDQKLRKLYAILYRHCKEYGGKSRGFYMTYQQMTEAGAETNRSRLMKKIKELAKLGKVEIVLSNFTPNGSMLKSPNEYRLPYCLWVVT